jgi:polyhydroxyalkanoate synthesis regulator phasin
MTFECIRCGYVTNTKGNLKKHYERKYPCQPVKNDIDVDICVRELMYKAYNEKTYDCKHCGRKFNTLPGKSRHSKICKAEMLVQPSMDELVARIDTLERELIDVKGNSKSITINNDNSTTNQMVNIVINDFNSVDGGNIPGSAVAAIIEKIRSTDAYYHAFEKVLEMIYFDPERPENHTWIIPNKKEKLAQIIKDGKMRFQDRKLVTELAVNETRNTIHNEYDDNPYRYSIITQQTMDKMDKKYDDNDIDHMKSLISKAELASFNNKGVIESTWKAI